jgi:hypothetical protein
MLSPVQGSLWARQDQPGARRGHYNKTTATWSISWKGGFDAKQARDVAKWAHGLPTSDIHEIVSAHKKSPAKKPDFSIPLRGVEPPQTWPSFQRNMN